MQEEFCKSLYERGVRLKPGVAISLCGKDKGKISTVNARKFQKYERPQKPRVIREGFLKKVILKLGGDESVPPKS